MIRAIACAWPSSTWRSMRANLRTDFECLAGNDLGCLRCTLHTGRTHQIRAYGVHRAPLVGDGLGGGMRWHGPPGAARLSLPAFVHPVTGALEFHALARGYAQAVQWALRYNGEAAA